MDEYEILDQQCREAVGLDESIAVLMRLLSDGYAVWDDGSLYSVKQLVASIKGLKIEVFSREDLCMTHVCQQRNSTDCRLFPRGTIFQ